MTWHACVSFLGLSVLSVLMLQTVDPKLEICASESLTICFFKGKRLIFREVQKYKSLLEIFQMVST